MSSRREQRALLNRFYGVADAADIDALIDRIVRAQTPLTIAFVNQHAFNLYGRDAQFRAAIADVDILLRDGIGISVLMRALGLRAGLNMNGTDFIPLLTQRFIERVPHCSAHAYGTASPWLERGAKKLFGEKFAAVQLVDGFSAPEHYARRVAGDNAQNKFVVLAMGMPKQENIAVQLKRAADGAAIIVCGGAILDFCANKVRRAPRWVRTLRLEWLFRLLLEPRRLFSRYVVGGIEFASTLVLLGFSEKFGRHEKFGTAKSERNAVFRTNGNE